MCGIPSVAGFFRNIVAAIFRDLSRYSPIFSDILRYSPIFPSSCMRRAAGGGSCMLRCVGSPATPREARPFHGLIERDRALRAAFLPEVREFISQGVNKRMVVSAQGGCGPWAPNMWLEGARYCAILRDIARYCAILCDTFRYLAINHELSKILAKAGLGTVP